MIHFYQLQRKKLTTSTFLLGQLRQQLAQHQRHLVVVTRVVLHLDRNIATHVTNTRCVTGAGG